VPRAALPALRQEKGRAAAYPDVTTLASHTKKGNPTGPPSTRPHHQRRDAPTRSSPQVAAYTWLDCATCSDPDHPNPGQCARCLINSHLDELMGPRTGSPPAGLQALRHNIATTEHPDLEPAQAPARPQQRPAHHSTTVPPDPPARPRRHRVPGLATRTRPHVGHLRTSRSRSLAHR
jgi:hypothetical protein